MGIVLLPVWLFLHPSAWRVQVARIDPTLPPDFCLAELRASHWRHPALQQLLVQGYVVTDPEALAEMRIPEGETVVEVPPSLMKYLPPEEPQHGEGHS